MIPTTSTSPINPLITAAGGGSNNVSNCGLVNGVSIAGSGDSSSSEEDNVHRTRKNDYSIEFDDYEDDEDDEDDDEDDETFNYVTESNINLESLSLQEYDKLLQSSLSKMVMVKHEQFRCHVVDNSRITNIGMGDCLLFSLLPRLNEIYPELTIHQLRYNIVENINNNREVYGNYINLNTINSLGNHGVHLGEVAILSYVSLYRRPVIVHVVMGDISSYEVFRPNTINTLDQCIGYADLNEDGVRINYITLEAAIDALDDMFSENIDIIRFEDNHWELLLYEADDYINLLHVTQSLVNDDYQVTEFLEPINRSLYHNIELVPLSNLDQIKKKLIQLQETTSHELILENMHRIYPYASNAQVAAEKKIQKYAPCHRFDNNSADHNGVHDRFHDRTAANSEMLRDLFTSKLSQEKIREIEANRPNWIFKYEWNKSNEICFEEFMSLPREKQEEILVAIKNVVRQRVININSDILNHITFRRCFSGVHQFMIIAFGEFNLKLSYELCYTLRMVTLIHNLSFHELYRFLCGKEFTSVEMSIATILSLTRQERLSLLLVKPAAKAHSILSSLLRGRKQISLAEYVSIETLQADIRDIISGILNSTYIMRYEWALSLEMSLRALVSRFGVGTSRAAQRLGNDKYTLRDVWHFIPRGSGGFLCIHEKYHDRCGVCNPNCLCNEVGCNKFARGGSKHCVQHGGKKGKKGKVCSFVGCETIATSGFNKCNFHGGRKTCDYNGCTKQARSSSNQCVRHGDKKDKKGKKGKSCNESNCSKFAISGYLKCSNHGGGKKCGKCGRTNAVSGSDKCGKCGGSKKCNFLGCTNNARSGFKVCISHGGKK